MARPLRIEYPGAIYHVTSRGNEKDKIFEDNRDREIFFEVLDSVVKRYNWLCHGYCLMGNHYHLVIETPDGNMSGGMRQLNGVYTQSFNFRHERVGHLFQGRYKAILVERGSYLLVLCRYVVLNPVRAELVGKPEDWAWSSYTATAGIKKGPGCLATDWILSQFSNDRIVAQNKYKEFVLAGGKDKSLMKNVQGQLFLGSEGFVERFKGLLGERGEIKEIPRTQRYADRPCLAALFDGEKMSGKREQSRQIYNAHVKFGYTLKEIATHLGIHYTTVSKAIKTIEAPKKLIFQDLTP